MPDLNDPGGDDLSGTYIQHAQAQTTDAEIAAFRERVQSRMQARPAGEPAAGGDAAPAGDRAKTRITVRPPRTPIADAIGAVGGDVAKGVFVESPTQIAGGARDAVQAAINGIGAVGDWLNENVADLGRVELFDTADSNIAGMPALRPRIVPAAGERTAMPQLPEVKQPTTVTGHVVREISQFLTGFAGAGRALGAAAPGGFAGASLKGAIADAAAFDASEQRLAGLIQSVPALQNPVTEYLAGGANESELAGRFKRAVEGLGFGVVAEGLLRGVRAIAQGRKAKVAIEGAQQEATEQAERAVAFLGDPAADAVVRPSAAKLAAAARATETGVPDEFAARGLAGVAGDAKPPPGKTAPPELYVNFARIAEPADVKSVIRDMANAFKGEIDETRRGVQTHAQTRELADALGMTVDDILARRAGQPFNAEEALAARRLLNTTAEKLLQAAQLAAGGDATALYNFRRMMTIHHAVQSEVIAARTETARALQSWSIPAGAGNAERSRMIEQLLETSGGTAVSQELARRVASLAGQDLPPGALANMVRRGALATSMDMVKESYVLGLLWSPSTHLVNAGSNLIVAFQQVYERAAARGIGNFLGSAVDARVVDGEALAMSYGMIASLKDALRLAARSAITGQSGGGIGRIDLPRQHAISSETVARERGLGVLEAQEFAESGMGRALDFIGSATRLPGNALAGADEFFKTIGYRAEVHAQSLRQATQEGLSGPDKFRRMAEIANDPPEHIRISAADAALYSTFQNKTGAFGEGLMRLRDGGSFNPTFVVLPFIRTPVNILRYAFERSPLAPLVSQWRDDIAAGGARADLALARMGTGTAIMAVGMDLASSGLITGAGPSDPGQRATLLRTGWQPNSIVVDGKYYSFNRADPLGMLLGFAGTLAEVMKRSEHNPENFDSWEEIMAAGIGAVSASVIDKTYFHGVSEVMTMIQRSEQGSTAPARWLDRNLGSLVPFSSALNTMRRFTDPVTRELNSPWDGIQSRIAGLSERLPPARDLWGAERRPQEIYGRVVDVVSPVAVRARTDSPIDDEMARLRLGVRRIEQRGEFQGADVSFRDFPAVYDAYVRLAGNEVKHPAWGLGAKDMLDRVVAGTHPLSDIYRLYSDGPEGGKAGFIRNIVREYRALAQAAIMADGEQFADFIAHVKERSGVRRRERQQLDPGITGDLTVPGGR